VRNLFARPKTPQWYTVPVEKGVLVSGSEDEAALASLQGHPGVQALLNRLKLQSAVLERQLVTVHHKDLHDVYFLQSGITWVRYVESELRKIYEAQQVRRKGKIASVDEAEQFQKIMNAIESVRPTRQ
jgi:hypothetical protein